MRELTICVEEERKIREVLMPPPPIAANWNQTHHSGVFQGTLSYAEKNQQ